MAKKKSKKIEIRPRRHGKNTELIIEQKAYIEQLERIIYDMTSLRDFMLHNHSEDIYHAIVRKYQPREESEE